LLLVIASELDVVAAHAARIWPEARVAMMTPRDLCRGGIAIEVDAFHDGEVVVQGKVEPVCGIEAAISLLRSVPQYELWEIDDGDRPYVASELTAFLFYFLSRLECPVLNRPSAHLLSGPSWGPLQWIWACRQCDLRTRPGPIVQPDDTVPEEQPLRCGTVHVLDDRTMRVGRTQADDARYVRLARLAGVRYLAVHASEDDDGGHVSLIDTVPNLADPCVAGLLRNHFRWGEHGPALGTG
jgi:hypothetical protein